MSSRYENVKTREELFDVFIEVLKETDKIEDDKEWYTQYLKDLEEFTPYYEKFTNNSVPEELFTHVQ